MDIIRFPQTDFKDKLPLAKVAAQEKIFDWQDCKGIEVHAPD